MAGVITIRITRTLHEAVKNAAWRRKLSMNAFCEEAILCAVEALDVAADEVNKQTNDGDVPAFRGLNQPSKERTNGSAQI